MAYEKRVCVLRQIKKGFSADGSALSGAIYAERLGDELTVTPRIPAIAPVREGRYALVLRIEGSLFCVELRGAEAVKISPCPSVKSGFSALLVFIKGEAEPVAFGNCGTAQGDYAPLLAALSEEEPKGRKREEPRPFRRREEGYDDEAIAAADYYQREADEDAGAGPSGVGDRKEAQDGRPSLQDEDPSVYRPRGTLAYYNTVRARIREAFAKYPKDDRLTAVFPHSEWVNAQSALLGVIYGEGMPRFLCVAVEAHGGPPTEMEGRASFVPLSAFTETEGFWVVFQSADSGEYVTVSQS